MNRSRRGTTAPRASRTGLHHVAAGAVPDAEPAADIAAYAVATALAVTAFGGTVGFSQWHTGRSRHRVEGQRAGSAFGRGVW